jgi:MFS superfamily sulfate permease-like transporter
LGLFLATSIAGLFSIFPLSIIGAMMFLVGIELTKFAKDIRLNKDLLPMGATLIVALLTNMAYGFLTGLIVYNVIRFIFRRKGYCKCQGAEVKAT